MHKNQAEMSQGEKIALLRKQKGMTQADLSDILNISPQAVSKWEREESSPDFNTISRIAKLFGVSIAYFEDGATMDSVRKELAPAQATVDTKRLMGICKKCQRAVYEGDEVKAQSGGVFCKSCVEEIKRKNEQLKLQEERRKQRREKRVKFRKNAGLITGGIVAVLLFILGVSESVSGALMLSLFFFTFTSQMFWNGAVKSCTLAGGAIIGTPGVIFELSLDGFIFLIAVKILFALVRFIIWLLTVLVCALVGILISPITFIPALIRMIRGKIEFDDDTIEELLI
ncbi:MAG: helix-turn-helix transcriptional regulator [Clostridia bacterium]|nr:helix-turn-helix transcriptional regulator [Clostridia bacterium]